MEDRDQEILDRMRVAEAERRMKANEPQSPRGPRSTNEMLVLCTIAICAVVAFTAYSMSDEAFWKPTGTQKVWCAMQGFSWWECRKYNDVEK
tara:strand:+ start:7471 stop:7746 length:276 start_codon:yes stop_codon:yes gene_type:complete